VNKLALEMDWDSLKLQVPSSPAFIIDEMAIVKNLQKLAALRLASGCKVLYSVKALPLQAVLNLCSDFVDGFSVSSLFEARLASELSLGSGTIHLATPGIKADQILELGRLCSHISFNSINQFNHLAEQVATMASLGIRINPKLSFLADHRFDPCTKYSKLGVDIGQFQFASGQKAIQGLHIHTLFAATSFMPLSETVSKLRQLLGDQLQQLDWLNLGGGYLYDEIDDNSLFVALVKQLIDDFCLEVYIEPGKAIVGQAGYLMATVIDSFVSDGKHIMVLDSSVNHHPEVFEFQQSPQLVGHEAHGSFQASLVGCSCLAGDVFGEYKFDKALKIGDRVVFKNLGAYSLVKANRFNGINFPDLYGVNQDGIRLLKCYGYEHYREQWCF
jgi:carboxynorspermidine decarboxylase